MPSKRFDLTRKVAIVTGSGRGIGHAIALGLAEEGADVVIADINAESAENTAKEIKSLGHKALAIKTDVTSLDEIRQLVKKTLDNFKKVDILVNCAGIALVTPAVDVDEKKWDTVMDINVKGAFFLCQEVGKVMIKQGKGGSIINITSEVVKKAELVPLGAYGPSKAALHSVTQLLATEWGKYKIRVNSLAPCFVMTEINKPLLESGDFYQIKLKRVPLGRPAQPEDLVGAAIFLASDASSYVSGITILVDGGFTAG